MCETVSEKNEWVKTIKDLQRTLLHPASLVFKTQILFEANQVLKQGYSRDGCISIHPRKKDYEGVF